MTIREVIVRHAQKSTQVPALPTKGLQSVCVIGATIGGLQAMNQFGKVGIPVKCYDKNRRVGGRWGTPHIGMTVPAPTELYQMPEVPPMKGVDYGEVGGSDQMLEYMRDYIFHMKINSNIFLCSSVEKIERRVGWGDWKVTIRKPDGSTKEELHDLIIVATHEHEDPIRPDYLENTPFQGKILHSSEVQDAGKIVNKNITIVGDTRAAYEIANTATVFAKSVNLVSNNPPLFYPTNFLNIPYLPCRHFFTSRLANLCLAPEFYMKRPRFQQHTRPVQWILQKLSNLTLRIPRSMRTKSFTDGQHIDSTFFKRIRKGKIKLHKGEVHGLSETEVHLEGNVQIPTDVFIYATDFEREKWLPETPSGLYRGIIDPSRKGIAYIGYAKNNLNYPLTCYIQAAWLRSVYFGKMRIPGQDEMEADIDYCNSFDFNDGFWDARIMAYHDQLISDMGAPIKYKPDFIREYLQAYTAKDYGAFKRKPNTVISKGPEGWKVQYKNMISQSSNEKNIFYIPSSVKDV